MSDSQRLRFILDGDDNLSRVLNHAGDSSARLHRRLNDDFDGNSQAVRRFTTDANGRLHDLRGRFVSTDDASRRMANGLPDLTRRLGDVADAGAGASSSLGSSGGGLSGVMLGVAGVAGLSLLPAIGALVPALAGAGAAAGTLKLGFAGVGKAMEDSGKDQKKYAEDLKKMGPEQRGFTKALVGLKKEFGPIGREVQKAMLPGFTKAVKDAGPVVKILGRSMTDLGGAFGKAAEGVGKLLKDSGFQKDLQTNLKLGTGFVKDMTTSLGPLIRSILDFGAASGPTLKSFSDGISGLLTKGLPGLIKGLTPGIGGAAKMLDGLFSAVNDILPAFGRLAGEMGKTLGPVFGESARTSGGLIAGAMDTVRGAIVLLRPVFRDIMFMIKNFADFGKIVGPTLRDTGKAILDAFLPLGSKINETATPMQRINRLIRDNKGAILEGARVFGSAMISMTGAAIQAAPKIIHMFRLVSEGVLTALDGIVSGAADAFGWIPGIGPKLKAANRQFDHFKDGYLGALSTAEHKASEFAASTTPKLAAGKLKLNIANWQQQIEAAKAKLKTVPPSKQAALKATIADLQAKVRQAKGDLASLHGKTVTVTVQINGVKTGVNPDQYYSQGPHRARGGPAPRFAAGGMPSGLLRGPGSGTSDSIPMWWASNGEYVVNARSASKYRSLIEAINSNTLGTSRGMPGAGAAAAQGLAGGMTGAAGQVGAAARLMAAAVVTGIKTELQIASPSKKTRALAHDVGKGFINGLTGSRDKIKAVARDLAHDIKTAFSGHKESSLLHMVDKDTKKLLDLAAKRDKIAAKIAAAKAFASDVTRNARENAGLSNLGMQPEQVTAGGIKAGLAQKLAQIRQFTQYIGILAKKGLNKGLLRQILNMGPEAGYAYASALVGADKTTFKQINSLQSQLDRSTDRLGELGADRLYDSGKNAGKGFLKGLEGQQKDIEKLMLNIAKGMQKAIKKALGIKSPSTVMARLGAYSTEGLAHGLLQSVPHIDRALDVITGRIAGAQPVLGRPAVAGRGTGGTVIHIHVDGTVVDENAVALRIQKALLGLKRHHGGKQLGIA